MRTYKRFGVYQINKKEREYSNERDRYNRTGYDRNSGNNSDSIFGILILFIGSSVDDTGIFGIMLIIAVILLVCILILYEHQRRLADALNILMLIWISIAESGILTAKSQNTMASIVALVCLALTVIAALIVYQADEYSTILPSSFLGAAVCGLLGGWFFPYNLDDDPSKIFFLMLGIEIVLTAVGCLLQIFILE